MTDLRIFPLYTAVYHGDVYTVRKLLDSKAVNVCDVTAHGNQGIHLAARWGDAAMVRFLVSRHAPISARGGFGMTPLHNCGEYPQGSQSSCAEFLIDRRADVNAEMDNGRTALMHAADHGNFAVIRVLLERGAKIEKVAFTATGFGFTAFDLAVIHRDSQALDLLEKARKFEITNA